MEFKLLVNRLNFKTTPIRGREGRELVETNKTLKKWLPTEWLIEFVKDYMVKDGEISIS